MGAAHDKFVIHGWMGVTVCIDLFTILEKAKLVEDELEVFATTTPRLFGLDTMDKMMSEMITSLDMKMDIILSYINDFPLVS